jgi:hypothetical protein
MKPNLKVVPDEPAKPKPRPPRPYDDAKALRRLDALRGALRAAAAAYVAEGLAGSRGDRLRAASDASGVPRNLIETAS